MRKAIFIAVIALAGCASHPPMQVDNVPASQIHYGASQTPQQSAPIVVTRDAGKGIMSVDVSISGEDAAMLQPGESARIWTTPGPHVVSARVHGVGVNHTPQAKVIAQPGTPSKARIAFSPVWGWNITPE